MVTTISIALLALAIIANSVAIFFMNNKTEKVEMEGVNHRAKTGRHVEEKINELQPLIDKYKKERKRQHWKQYNDWEYYIEARCLENETYVCSECHSEDLEINRKYKRYTTAESYYLEDFIDYPLSAEYKCNTCGEVISKWEFKEDDH